jgi:hypothetical protein
MSDVAELRKAVSEIANEAGRRAATKEAADLAYERLVRFEPEIGGTLQCPSCWIHYGSQAPLVAVPAINPATTPGFRCEGCDFGLSRPFSG